MFGLREFGFRVAYRVRKLYVHDLSKLSAYPPADVCAFV